MSFHPLTTADRAREFSRVVLGAVLLAFFVRTFLFQAFVVPSPSMEDTVLVGDYLVVNKFVYGTHSAREESFLPMRGVRRGEVVVFQSLDDPRRDLIKRAVAVPGDELEIRDRVVVVNGEIAPEPWVRHSDTRVWPDAADLAETLRRRDQLPPTRIPEERYFMMGDNRDDSNDSRFWGVVPVRNIKGRALIIYWSSAAPMEETESGKQTFLRQFGHFFTYTRWSRLLRAVR